MNTKLLDRGIPSFFVGLVASILHLIVTSTLQNEFLVGVLITFLASGAILGALAGRHLFRTFMVAGLGTAVGIAASSGGHEVVSVFLFVLVVGIVPIAAGGLAALAFRAPGGRLSVARAALLIPAAAVAAFAISLAADLKRRPESAIRSRLLVAAPLGSSIGNVTALAGRHGWQVTRSDQTRGYTCESVPSPVIGVKHVEANAGHYSMFFRTDVVVLWGFDSEGRLIDVCVKKMIQAL